MPPLRIPRRAIYFILIAVSVLIAVAGYSWYRSKSVPETRTIAISELMNRAEHGDIPRVVIAGTVVTAVDRDNVRYRAIKEDSSPLTEILRRSGVEVIVDSPTGDVSPGLLLGLLPVLAIIAMFFLATRRTGVNNPTFSFGKSGARLQATQKPSITFDDVAGVEEAKQELREIVE